ncbi:hypothetical protein [Hymenobacter chitinivorans]|uniref:DUF3298 domain-containing protein n=1 Tax=Hymenobacter chitinivorans DSM 11115 TaxID=1121954 RepID=A0A2M9BRQ7_9BACT|nr:hypothetical protein [Hymenobacter chitinivorans]PJJ60611.1 hypothetical protein CLV45_2040 [Hymenobacter chitinivorans DSM 11115]
MKQLVRWLLGVGVVLSRAPQAGAQGAPGAQAQVYTVTDQTAKNEATYYQVPQVRLPDAAVARRINRQLWRFFTRNFSTLDSTASLHRQLLQAVHECCYDEEFKAWRAGGDGLTGFDYTVLLNQNYLLSFEFYRNWQGFQEPASYHLTFNLRTGRLVTLAELVADSPTQLKRRLGLAISRRLHDELAGVVASYGNDSALIARVAQLYGMEEWDTTPQAALRLYAGNGSEVNPDESLFPLTEFSLTEFALQPNALLLFYSVDMSRYDFEFLPDETYVFPYTHLQPRPLLQPVAQAAARKKK